MPKSVVKKRSIEQLEHLRATAVRLRQRGMKIDSIAKECGLSRTTVIAACKAHEGGDWKAVRLARRGRPKHSGRSMSLSQETEILKVMLEQTPEHQSMPSYLWTSAAVRKLASDLCGVELTDRAMRNYLKRWGLTRGLRSNKSLSQMYGQQKLWFAGEYPQVQARAFIDGSSIHFLNIVVVLKADKAMEAAVANAGLGGLAPVGRQVKQWILLRASSSPGHTRWKIYPGRLTTSALKDFCDRLCREVDGKILLILEPSKQALSARVQAWLSSRKEKIQFQYMPGQGE